MGLFDKSKQKREAELFFQTGNGFFDEKSYLLAIASYGTAVSKNPLHAGAACNAGFAYSEMQKY
jgi:hypothetical protein